MEENDVMTKSQFIVHFYRGGKPLKNSTTHECMQIEISASPEKVGHYRVGGDPHDWTIKELSDCGYFQYDPYEDVFYVDNPEDRLA